MSTTKHALVRATFLINLVTLGTLSLGCEAIEPCDSHAPNYPVGLGPNSNYLYECRFTNDEDWVTSAGEVVWYATAGGLWEAACGPLTYTEGEEGLSGTQACRARCVDLTAIFGIVNVDCETDIWADTSFDYSGMCPYYVGCNPDDLPEYYTQDPGEEPDNGVFCLADMNHPKNQDLNWNDHEDEVNDWKENECPGCIRYTFQTQVVPYTPTLIPMPGPCGYYVDVEAGQDPTDACRAECARLVLNHGGDHSIEDNCGTFIVNETAECTSEASAAGGINLVWRSARGEPEVEPLRCDRCCEQLGVCDRLSGEPAAEPVATERLQTRSPATLWVSGRGTPTEVDLAIDVLRARDGENVRPTYVETVSIAASFASQPVRTGVRNARGEEELVFAAHAVLRRPLMGAFRASTGELQVPADSTYELTLMVGPNASRATPRSSMFVSSTPLSAFVVEGDSRASLDPRQGEVRIAPEVTLSFSR